MLSFLAALCAPSTVISASFHHSIAGKSVPTDSRHLVVLNPATEEELATPPDASASQVDDAVSAARAAFPAWASSSAEYRRDCLLSLADSIIENQEELQQLELLEKGSNFPSIPLVAANIRALAEQYDFPDEELVDADTQRVTLSRRPLGVVAAIAPWNAPLVIGLSKVAAALVCGNTVVLKPSPFTPLATLRVGALAQRVLPPGVLNVVSGGDEAGVALVAHPAVAKVSFTGSVATGKAIMSSCSTRLARVTLEVNRRPRSTCAHVQ